MKIDEKTEVPASVLAKALGVSRMRVEQLAAEGVIKRLAKGRFLLLASVAGYVAWLKDEQRQAAKSAAAGKVQDQRAEEIALRIAERRQTHLIEAQAEAVAIIDEFAGQLRSDIMAIPARVTADIGLRRRIEDQIDEAFGAAGERAGAAASRVDPPRSIVGQAKQGKSGRVDAKQPGLSAKRGRARAA
jgi:hypothetical protein